MISIALSIDIMSLYWGTRKTFHLNDILDSLKAISGPGTKLISTHNGLGPEDLIADRFGKDSAFRMSLNFGASLKSPGRAEVAFLTNRIPWERYRNQIGLSGSSLPDC